MDVMTEHKVVPKLRFRGFTKDLKKNGFTELGKIMIGLTHTPKYIEFGKIFLSSKNISKGYIDFENVKYISEGEYEGITKSAKPKKGDILFT
jgi:type I restriction enzyme S subunit